MESIPNDLAVIFDMDGVIINNNYYHRQAWKEFCGKYHFSFTEEEIIKYIYGRINKEILSFLFKKDLSDKEIDRYSKEKEIIYREIYKPHISLPEGLHNFLEELKINNIKTAVATSAPRENVNFVFENLSIEKYFDVVTDESKIKNGKPDPEIYLKTSDLLGIEPERCIVIEDSVPGIKSAKSAGMKVIAITTTHSKESLYEADVSINSFKELNKEKIIRLIENMK